MMHSIKDLMSSFMTGKQQEVEQRELTPVQRAIIDELRRRGKKPKAKIYRSPDDPNMFHIPDLNLVVVPHEKEKMK